MPSYRYTILRLDGTSRSCAYLALESTEERDVCTHREVWQTQTYLDETCNNYSNTFNPANLAWANDFGGDLELVSRDLFSWKSLGASPENGGEIHGWPADGYELYSTDWQASDE